MTLNTMSLDTYNFEKFLKNKYISIFNVIYSHSIPMMFDKEATKNSTRLFKIHCYFGIKKSSFLEMLMATYKLIQKAKETGFDYVVNNLVDEQRIVRIQRHSVQCHLFSLDTHDV
jgi:hypothetical protein